MSENTTIEFTQPTPEAIQAHYDYVSAQKFQELHAAGLAGNAEPYRSDPTKEDLLRKMLNEYAHDIGAIFHREVPKPAEPEIQIEHLTEPATPVEK